MKVAIAQINTAVNAVEYNAEKAIGYIRKAAEAGADLVVFPEMTLPGYPPKDLLLSDEFVGWCEAAIEGVRAASKGIGVVIGGLEKVDGALYNTAFVFEEGRLIHKYHKQHLPNYDVFDEKRYFTSGTDDGIFEFHGKKIGISICEDIWIRGGPVDEQAKKGAELLINLSASPFYLGKTSKRMEVIGKHYTDGCKVPLIYVNQIGGQDDIVFDGESYAFNGSGKLIARADHFKEQLLGFFLNYATILPRIQGKVEEAYSALVLGLRDFVHKNGFTRAILGLSGGVDSALAATIAADALGSKNVLCVSMPSEFTSQQSKNDAQTLAFHIKVNFTEVPIDGVKAAYERVLEPNGKGKGVSVAEENIQARIRANTLYYYSNRDGYMVLNTSNKSEAAVGYGTIYGDMTGGYAVISDVPKTLVYELCYYINKEAGYDRIPLSILEKAPSAELKPDQKDSDSLPPYPILDRIINEYVEQVKSPQEIVRNLKGEVVDKEMVAEVIRQINAAEHKRKQSPPGTKITPLAFGTGRRMPIAKLAPIG